MQRYLRCIVRGIPSRTGVPDGDNHPSIVRNLRSSVTLKPNSNGSLLFYVVLNPNGTVQQVSGADIASTPYYTVMSTQATGIGWTAGTGPGALVGPKLLLTPTDPSSAIGPGILRVVSAVHRVTFTGSSLANGGYVTVDQRDLTRMYHTTIATTGTARQAALTSVPSYTELGPLALAGPARNSFSLMH